MLYEPASISRFVPPWLRWLLLAMVLVILGCLTACAWPKWLPKDSSVENNLEYAIKEKTGISVDFSP